MLLPSSTHLYIAPAKGFLKANVIHVICLKFPPYTFIHFSFLFFSFLFYISFLDSPIETPRNAGLSSVLRMGSICGGGSFQS